MGVSHYSGLAWRLRCHYGKKILNPLFHLCSKSILELKQREVLHFLVIDSPTVDLAHMISSWPDYINGIAVKTKARIVEGDAGKIICKEAERLKPATVVIGTRGRCLIQSVLHGSTSEYCFHNCKIAPIIIVPGKRQGKNLHYGRNGKGGSMGISTIHCDRMG